MKSEKNPRNAGRKPAQNPKIVPFNMRLTPETKAEWKEKAEKFGLDVSAMVELAVKKL